MAKDGELYDKHGIPLYRGDLICSPHFKTRRKQYWLYHVCVWNESQNTLEMVPASERGGGGRYWPTQELMDDSTILHGFGPGYIPYPQKREDATK